MKKQRKDGNHFTYVQVVESNLNDLILADRLTTIAKLVTVSPSELFPSIKHFCLFQSIDTDLLNVEFRINL